MPILPGLMPVFNVKMMRSLASLCGATITNELESGLAALPEGDKKALSAFGIDFAVRQCRELVEHGVPGIHIYTMDKSKAATGIVNSLRADGLV